MRRDLLLLAALVLLIRLPFLAQPVQGDDVYYLAMARNGLADPLHPMQMGYVYQGQRVWMAGHSHPPLNNYILLLLLAAFGGVHEAAFHAVYIVFSLLAVGAVYFLGRRLTPRPLAAALLFLAVPAFVLSGNKLEADLPFLALWLLGFALYVYERPLWAVLPLALSGLAAYQAVFAAPILAWWFWKTKPGGRWGWRQWPYPLAMIAPAVALGAWQLFEMASGAAMPAAQLAGYHTSWNLGGFERRVRNALALTIHLGWFLFPLLALFVFRLQRWVWTLLLFAASAVIAATATPGYALGERTLVAVSLGVGLCIVVGAFAMLRTSGAGRRGFPAQSNQMASREAAHEAGRRTLPAGTDSDGEQFLAAWVVLFFAAALAAFYAGAARYLLPLAAPLALLAARAAAKPLLAAAVGLQLAFSLLLATAYYQYVSQYRDFAARLEPLVESRRLWFNADWGLRYYLEAIGGEAVLADRPLSPQAALVTSRLGGMAPVQTLGQRRQVLRTEIRSGAIPLTVVGVSSHSGNASAGFGLLPFDYGEHLLDEVVAEVVGVAEPTASYLTMAAPQAENHLLLGFHELEQNQWRWISPHAMAVLRAPGSEAAGPGAAAGRDSESSPATFELSFYIPETAPARTVTVHLDGKPLASQTYPGPGTYTLQAPAAVAPGQTVTVEISADQAFHVAGDARELGIIVTGLGFVPGR